MRAHRYIRVLVTHSSADLGFLHTCCDPTGWAAAAFGNTLKFQTPPALDRWRDEPEGSRHGMMGPNSDGGRQHGMNPDSDEDDLRRSLSRANCWKRSMGKLLSDEGKTSSPLIAAEPSPS